MKIKHFVILAFYFLAAQVIVAQIDNESNFYKPIENKGIVKNLEKDYGVKTNLDKSATLKIQKAVDELSGKGGGTLHIPKGNYLLSTIVFKSNVHIIVDKDVVIILKQEVKNNTLFAMGEKNQPTVKNVSITCSDKNKKFVVDLTNSGDVPSVVTMGNVENFLISGFEVKDNFTKFSSIRMGIDENNGSYFYPTNGIIKNCSTINSHYGYGLIQSQSCKNVLFKDLSGIGGVTLRLETGAKNVNDLQVGGNFNVVARNISGKNGNAVIMVSPHALQNGTVDIDGAYGESCGFVLRIENGFIASKYNKDSKIQVGSYEQVTAKNIKGVYGTEAQLKSKHFKFMPCELRSQIHPSPENENRATLGTVPIFTGPAIGVVVVTDEYPTSISNVEAIGFNNQAIMKESDADNCGDAPIVAEKKVLVTKDKSDQKTKVKNKESKTQKLKNEGN